MKSRSGVKYSGSAIPLIVAAAAVWIGIAIVVGVIVANERDATIERASSTAEALALVLESQTARTMQIVDVTLAGVAEALRRNPGLDMNDREFQAALTRRLDLLRPYIRAIYVLGPDGWIRHDTDYPATPKVSLADRPYFIRHRQNPELVSSVSAPLSSRSKLGWFIAVSRRIGATSEFKGIVVAAVQPQYFKALYQRMGLGAEEIISLYHRSGVLVSQFPEEDQRTGNSFAQFPLFAEHLPKSPSGSFITGAGVFPFDSLVSYRAVESLPLVVAMTQRMDTVLAPWRRMAIGAAAGMAGLLVLLTVVVGQLLRRRRLRDRVRKQKSQADKLEALGHLTRGIAHDFNNLLGVMSSSVAVIAHRLPQESSQRNALAAAERAIARGTTLIERLSTFARSHPMHAARADLNACVSACRGMLQRAAGPSVEIVTDLAPDLGHCILDETELEIALVNLVVNARDAMNGTGQITISTYDCDAFEDAAQRRWGPAASLCLSVQDNGPGIPEHIRQHAFEPYYTTKGDKGTGLGLAQVYGFVKQVGGEARIDSPPGAGTTVELLFPKA